MTTYVALLRGINVGGQKLIRMAELQRVLTAAGFKKVRTYIQSGNVFFESRSTNVAEITTKFERTLKQDLGHEVTVMLRTLDEIEKLVNDQPFKKFQSANDVGLLVV